MRTFDAGGSVLVIGAAGMLGRAMCHALRDAEAQFEGVDAVANPDQGIEAFDLTSPEDLAEIAAGRWSVVINCAAWTDVDGAEANEAGATRLNGEAVGWLADACRDGGAVCVHFSTDYVFDGLGTVPYPTDHPVSPVNAYGRSKAVGERLLAASDAAFVVVRTSWLYGAWGTNFVRTMRGLMQTRDTLKVVDDQRGRPTSVGQLTGITLGLLDAGARGVFHGCDGGECTWYEFASLIRDEIGAATVITPCSSDAFPRPAVRPAYSVLDLSETVAIVGEPVAWQDEVRRVLAEIQAAETLSA